MDARKLDACQPPSDESVDNLVCRVHFARHGAGLYILARAGAVFETYYATGRGTNHGGSHLFDRSVPLLARARGRIAAGRTTLGPLPYTAFARTAATLLGIEPPGGSARDAGSNPLTTLRAKRARHAAFPAQAGRYMRSLAFLVDRHRAPGAQLVVLWGRRRAGKTALLARFAQQQGVLYHLATRATPALELRRFSERVAEHFADPVVGAQPFSSWHVAWRYLARLPEPPALILDEFPYLAEADPSFMTVLQAGWDEHLQPAGARLYLCGSSVGMVERMALAHEAPLCGRRTGQWRVEPLAAWHLSGFLRGTFDHLLQAYAIFGGIPRYLSLLEPGASLATNVVRHVLEPGAPLFEEVPFLLREELREVPITDPKPDKSRSGLYRIVDPFARCWLRFVHGHRDRLELGDGAAIWRERISPALDAFVAPVAEDVTRAMLCETTARQLVPFEPVWRGRHWGPEAELDVVLLDEARRKAFVAEVKWSRRRPSAASLDDLRRRVATVPALGGLDVTYAS
jgi:hypothetical protein